MITVTRHLGQPVDIFLISNDMSHLQGAKILDELGGRAYMSLGI